jgi:N-acetyl-gamma-glutamyl-phosphate reductase
VEKINVYVDGQEGTTGLKILERLQGRDDIDLRLIDPVLRKDNKERQKLINQADVVFLCLPDDASREAVGLCTNSTTRFIDASTAFRIDPSWAYGLPELSKEHRLNIKNAMRVSNPGCYATGFVCLLYPLVQAGIVPADYPVVAHGISGYSGAGKKAIAEYETAKAPENRYDYERLRCPRPYALNMQHKHLPEMRVHAGLKYAPAFTPIIGDYSQGMIVQVPLINRILPERQTVESIHAVYRAHYRKQEFIEIADLDPQAEIDGGLLNPQALNDTNRLDIMVHGCAERILLTARLDNLGKGASGAAVQSMNIMFDRPQNLGLQ